MKLCIVYGVCAGGAEAGSAKTEWTRAVTVVDGAAVYEQPNFDSTVVEYIGENKPLVVSRRAIRGVGGLGLFYRLKANNRIYYITDTDIKVKNSSDSTATEETSRKSKTSRQRKKKPRVDSETGEEITPYFTRYLGGAAGLVNFSEKFSGRTLSAQIPVYGIRFTGPGVLMDGPPLDMNVLFSFQAPDYYSKFGSAKGFMLHGDLAFQAPFYEWRDSYVYYGLGLMWVYTSYKVRILNSTFDSQELRVGADFAVGYAMRFDQYAVRADYKYFYEATQYTGLFLSFQSEY